LDIFIQADCQLIQPNMPNDPAELSSGKAGCLIAGVCPSSI